MLFATVSHFLFTGKPNRLSAADSPINADFATANSRNRQQPLSMPDLRQPYGANSLQSERGVGEAEKTGTPIDE